MICSDISLITVLGPMLQRIARMRGKGCSSTTTSTPPSRSPASRVFSSPSVSPFSRAFSSAFSSLKLLKVDLFGRNTSCTPFAVGTISTGVVRPLPLLPHSCAHDVCTQSLQALTEIVPIPWRQSSGPLSFENWSSQSTWEGLGPETPLIEKVELSANGCCSTLCITASAAEDAVTSEDISSPGSSLTLFRLRSSDSFPTRTTTNDAPSSLT
mmetsp:Transcript_53320/g.126875  ORF Transcript_53320/g.126875 Transcript_53320/m.126875 type:complete len:212 (+) Transcript_53320:226-861(+)